MQYLLRFACKLHALLRVRPGGSSGKPCTWCNVSALLHTASHVRAMLRLWPGARAGFAYPVAVSSIDQPVGDAIAHLHVLHGSGLANASGSRALLMPA